MELERVIQVIYKCLKYPATEPQMNIEDCTLWVWPMPCELEGLSEKHCSLKATCAVRDTNTFECITLKFRLYVNCKPPHALNLIQNTKPMHSHSHHQQRRYRESLYFQSYILTAVCILHFWRNYQFLQGRNFFPSTNQKRQTMTSWYDQSITCVHCAVFIHRQMDTQSVKSSKHPPDSTHLCFHPSWHQVGLCGFFNICKSLQTEALARFSQQGQVELMRMTAQLLNQIWGFNISWKRDRMWASINTMERVYMSCISK